MLSPAHNAGRFGLSLMAVLAVGGGASAQSFDAQGNPVPRGAGQGELAQLPPPPPAFAEQRFIVGLRLNGRMVDDAVLVIRRPDGFYMPRPALTAAGITVSPQSRFISGPGADYIALDGLAGATVTFDEAAQELLIVAGAGVVAPQAINLGVAQPQEPVRTVANGGFLNYDLVGQTGLSDYVAGYLDGGLSIGSGVFLTSALANSSSHDSILTRLDTSYIFDVPEDRLRLKVGDGVSRGGDWGRPYRFGGLQMATNFEIQPGYVPFPVPGMSGQAALPSTVDVFVDNALRYRGTVEQGPFAVNQIPAGTGGGEAVVVLTDPLGRQESVRLPYYVSQRLLHAGTSSYSYEVGALRQAYQTESAHYDHPVISATHRYGLSDQWTVEGHTDMTDSHQAAGGSVTTAIPAIGEITVEAAGAQGGEDLGSLIGYGYTRDMRPWTFSFRQRWISGDFQNPDIVGTLRNTTSETVASASLATKGFGSFSVSATRLTYEQQSNALIGSLFWSMPVGQDVFTGCYALAAHQNDNQYTLGCGVTLLFGNRNSISTESQWQDGKLTETVQARHAAGVDNGLGYGVTASNNGVDRLGGDTVYRTAFGDFSAAAESFNRQANGRLGASGGFAFVDGRAFASRRIDDSFALVSVPGYSDITVMQENRVIGKTDADGELFIPKLLSNYPIRIDLDTADLPMDADIESANKVLVAGYRSPMRVAFKVRQTSSRLITVRTADGAFPQPGSLLTRRSDGETYRVGYNGEAYLDLTGATGGDLFDLQLQAGDCSFRLSNDTANAAICRSAP